MKPYFAIALLPLALSACGDSSESGAAADGRAASNRQILEGTIDDSMIDLTGIETPVTLDAAADSASAEKADANAPAEAAEETAPETADTTDAAEDGNADESGQPSE